MYEYTPLLFVGAIIGLFSAVLLFAYFTMKDKKEAFGFDRNMKDGEILRRLLRYAKPYVWNFVAVLFIVLFSISYDVLSPYLIGEIEGMIKEKFELPRLYTLVAIYASILVVSLVGTYFQALILQKTGQRIVSRVREDLFAHIEKLSHGQLSREPVGKLVTRVTNDTEAISVMFTSLFVNLVKNGFIIVGVLVAMLCLNYALSLMVFCFAPFIVLFTLIFRKFSRRAHRKVKDGTTSINVFLSESFSGMKVIQIFNREDRKLDEFNARNEKLGKAKIEKIFVFGIFRPLVYMLYISCVLCLFYFGAKGYIGGTVFLGQTITAETVVAFYMYISKFFNPIQSLAEQFHRLQAAFASAEKIFTVFDEEPDVVDESDAIDLPSIRGEIEFRDVWFSYLSGEWVLKGVSFHVNAGETVAFVGATGSGKTTILSLLCRNYDIQKGQILLDGIDIRHIKIASLRSHFGQMLQDVFLFSGTVRSNILLQKENISDSEIMEVCRYVNADRFIERLPGKLDEEVRERGSNFSAGERQLLSFARTLIHKPEIVILDEATANIDTETERLIQDSLARITRIGTTLMVAHRLSTVRHADRIIVLSHGEILEEGTHDALIANRGRYYTLYTMQADKERLQKM